ncbi:MAG: DUF2254 domain-containing protein [Chloroflexota bacterium]|nr:DUF2254 domain-containing protein [Chloroflexota bacterium]
MRSRVTAGWYELQQRLWFLPAVITGLAVALAFLTLRIDQELLRDRDPGPGWIFGGGAEGARGVLAAISGTMVTVTALVFSITVVSLQLASSQLTPRVLRSFMADRGNQIVLGFFIGTFTYALLVLRAVRSPLEDTGSFVPSLSVTVSIALALISVALLIYYVHHAANAMRAAVVIDRAARVTLDLVERLYANDDAAQLPPLPAHWQPAGVATVVRAGEGGYLQGVDERSLLTSAEEHAAVVRVELRVGEFALPGGVIASVWPEINPKQRDGWERAIRAALPLGLERTPQTDIELGMQQLVDIAVKALSPGINDPSTAKLCIDRLGEVLVALGNRGSPAAVCRGEDGSVRLVLHPPPFDRLVSLAFDQIRHYGVADPTLAAHLVTTLGMVAALLPISRQEPMVRQGRLILAAAETEIALADDRETVARAGAWVSAGECGVARCRGGRADA